eukprot:scaffold5635_cov120-Isochrysis_galbana.AAC.1
MHDRRALACVCVLRHIPGAGRWRLCSEPSQQQPLHPVGLNDGNGRPEIGRGHCRGLAVPAGRGAQMGAGCGGG